MRIYVLAVGERMPAWVDDAFHDYASRLSGACRIELKEIAAGRRTKNADVAQLLKEEGVRLRAAVPADARTIALDRLGKTRNTEQIAEAMSEWMASGRDVAFWIGGPEGLAPECLQAADATWSLSALTLPHPLVRVVLAEQLYRAWSILNHLPYHR